jgi:integrase
MLTQIGIKNLKPRSERYEEPAGANLYIIVQPSGKKSYAVRYRFAGKPRKLTLPAGLSLAEARAEAAAAILKVSRGIDPTLAKRGAREAQRVAAANTFKTICENYFKREGGKLRSADWQQKLLARSVFPTIGDMPIGEIKRKAVIALLDKVEDHSGATSAHMVKAVVGRIMNWHATRDEDYSSPIVRGMSRIKPRERARSRILDDTELRKVWKTAEERAGDPFADAVRFLLLTAARRTEVAAMPWDEIEGTDWLLPPARDKAKAGVVRPLSKLARDLLAARPRIEGNPFVFSYGKSALGNGRHKAVFDEACGVTGWTLHDLRRTARSLMARAGVPADHAELCLGHVISGIRGIYDRHAYRSEKPRAYEALASLISSIVDPPAGNVVELKRG